MTDKTGKRARKNPGQIIKKKSAIPSLLFPTATSGNRDGEIDLVWKPVTSARFYIIQKSSGSLKPANWKNEDIITSSSYTVSKLKSGHKYWFRVAAVGSWGQGPWSKPVKKKAVLKTSSVPNENKFPISKIN